MYRDYTFSRNDTMLIQRPNGTWERVAANFPALTYKDDDNGKYRAGAWIPKTLTNRYQNSEPTSGGFGVTYPANYWSLFPFLTNVIRFDSTGGVESNRYDVGAFTPAANSWGTFAFLCQSEDGNKPTVAEGNSQVRLIYGGVGINYTPIIEENLGNGLWYFCIQVQASASPNSNSGFRQPSTYTGGLYFDASLLMICEGQHTITLLDYIRTTGASATRQTTDIRNTSFPLLDNLQGFIDVEITTTATNQRIVLIGADNGNYLGVTKNTANQIVLAYVVGGSTVWSITSTVLTSGRHRIAWYVSNGKNILWVNGVEVNRNTNAYTALGNILVLGRNATLDAVNFTNGGFFGQFMASGFSEAKLIEEFSFDGISEWAAFKRAAFDDESLTTSAITLLQNTEL